MKSLLRRNLRLFFRDKGLFLVSLITPVILLVLYISFLGNVYRDTFRDVFQPFGGLKDQVLSGAVGAQLMSSLLAVCCVTVSFCSNFLMVQDKVTAARRDFLISPTSPKKLAAGYYLSTVCATLLVCLVATALCLVYVAVTGWFLSFGDVLWILLDVVLLVLFGTALSSIINTRLSSQGQISAVGTIVSSGYGFLCGAYMPISQFSPALQKALSFLPGTYGTSLLRNHCMGGVFRQMEKDGIPEAAIEDMKRAMDCHIFFFDTAVPVWAMFAILGGTVLVLMGIYLLIGFGKRKEK